LAVDTQVGQTGIENKDERGDRIGYLKAPHGYQLSHALPGFMFGVRYRTVMAQNWTI